MSKSTRKYYLGMEGWQTWHFCADLNILFNSWQNLFLNWPLLKGRLHGVACNPIMEVPLWSAMKSVRCLERENLNSVGPLRTQNMLCTNHGLISKIWVFFRFTAWTPSEWGLHGDFTTTSSGRGMHGKSSWNLL